MPRLFLFAGMFTLCVFAALLLGLIWARHAPALPPAMRSIIPGMTIAEVETRLGQRLSGIRACTAVDYYVQVPDHWWESQVTYLYFSAPPRPGDVDITIPITDGGDLVCRLVDVYHLTKLDTLREYPWVYDLVQPDG